MPSRKIDPFSDAKVVDSWRKNAEPGLLERVGPFRLLALGRAACDDAARDPGT